MRSQQLRSPILLALLYLAVAVGGCWLLAGQGSPELAPAALIAQAFTAAGLFLWYRVDTRVWRPYLWPAMGVAAACVLAPAFLARKAPWAMTPSFLAPRLRASDFESLETRLQTKAKVSGRVLWWDEYPFGTGLEDPVKVRLETEDGAVDAIVDRAGLEDELEAGQLVALVGRIRRWEGRVVRFVALEADVEPAP